MLPLEKRTNLTRINLNKRAAHCCLAACLGPPVCVTSLSAGNRAVKHKWHLPQLRIPCQTARLLNPPASELFVCASGSTSADTRGCLYWMRNDTSGGSSRGATEGRSLSSGGWAGGFGCWMGRRACWRILGVGRQARINNGQGAAGCCRVVVGVVVVVVVAQVTPGRQRPRRSPPWRAFFLASFPLLALLEVRVDQFRVRVLHLCTAGRRGGEHKQQQVGRQRQVGRAACMLCLHLRTHALQRGVEGARQLLVGSRWRSA